MHSRSKTLALAAALVMAFLAASMLIPALALADDTAYDWVFGTFRDGHSIRHATVTVNGKAYNLVDVYDKDDHATIRTGYGDDMEGAPFEYTMINTVGGLPYTGISGVQVRSVATGKCGVLSWDGEVIVPCSYTEVLFDSGSSAGLYAGIDVTPSAITCDLYKEGVGKCASHSTPIDVAEYDHVEAYPTIAHGLITIRAGLYVPDEGMYSYKKVADGTVTFKDRGGNAYEVVSDMVWDCEYGTGNAIVEHADGNLYYVPESGDEALICPAADVLYISIGGDLVSVTHPDYSVDYYNRAGQKISLPDGCSYVSGTVSGMLLAMNDSFTEYALVKPDNSVYRTFTLSNHTCSASGVGDYYHYCAKDGDQDVLVVCDRDGNEKARVPVANNYASLYTDSSGESTCYYVPAYCSATGEDVYFDSDFKPISEESIHPTLTMGNGTVVVQTRTEELVSVTDKSGQPIQLDGKQLSIYTDKQTFAYGSTVKHSGTDDWWAYDVNTGKWGTVDSNGSTSVPFSHDGYFDAGDESGYALVLDGGAWKVLRFEGDGPQPQANPFKDVVNDAADASDNTPHASEILWLADAGISQGWTESDGSKTFRPLNRVERADMAAFLFRLGVKWGVVDANWKPTEKDKQAFSDVTDTGSKAVAHAREIWWLASAGISTGWKVGSSKEFRPYQTVARQDMAAFMFRLAKLAGKGGASDSWTASDEAKAKFADVDGSKSDNHHDEVWWLAETGVSAGWDIGNGKFEFRGMQPVARCDMAAFLYRMDGLPAAS